MCTFVYLDVICHPFEHSVYIQTPKTLPCCPTLYLAHYKAHKTPTETKPFKELKMLTHNPPTLANEYLSSLIQLITIISLLSTQAHPAPNLHSSYRLDGLCQITNTIWHSCQPIYKPHIIYLRIFKPTFI